MSERSSFPSSLTRRDVVKGAVALATLGAGSVLAGRDPAAAAASPARPESGGARSHRHRVATVGAGAGGVAAAYILADTLDVDLFEARSKIGGHCDSHVIDYRGRRITVDLGAQFFHPDTHPIYVTAGGAGPLRSRPPPTPTTRSGRPAACASSRRPGASRSFRRTRSQRFGV